MGFSYLESVLIVAIGWSSTPCSRLSRLRSHSSSLVSSEKSASTAPARVPVTTKGDPEPGDQANAPVRGISLNLTILEVGFVSFEVWFRDEFESGKKRNS